MNTVQTKWLPIVSRRFTLFRLLVTAVGSRDEVAKYLGQGCDWLSIVRDELGEVYLDAADTRAMSARVVNKIKDNSNYPTELALDCRDACAQLVFQARKSSVNVSTVTNQVLLKAFIKFCDAYINFTKFMVIPVALEQTLTNNITNALAKKNHESGVAPTLANLMTTPAFSEFQKESIDLLQLAIAVKRNTQQEKVLLAQHVKKYCWLCCYNIDEEAYTEAYFKERLKLLLTRDEMELKTELNLMLKQMQTDTKVYEQTMDEHDFSDHVKKEIELLRELVYLRTFRVEMQSKTNFFIQPLFLKIACRLGLSLRHLCALAPDEIMAALTEGTVSFLTVDLEQRCKNYALRYDKNGLLFTVGPDEVAKIVLAELGGHGITQTPELKGAIAYKGVASGRVRVVLTKEHIKEFEGGEILVTTMTTPEFVPAMKKAAAIVTNEGGVLCHAAIVARELKVPCVIGTGHATKVFETGDYIEVDADHGMVKKIETR